MAGFGKGWRRKIGDGGIWEAGEDSGVRLGGKVLERAGFTGGMCRAGFTRPRSGDWRRWIVWRWGGLRCSIGRGGECVAVGSRFHGKLQSGRRIWLCGCGKPAGVHGAYAEYSCMTVTAHHVFFERMAYLVRLCFHPCIQVVCPNRQYQ
jgi:hypothetical protein